MALRPSSVPLLLCLLLLSPSLPEARDPESDRTRAASPTVARLLATDITDPSFESAAASALIAELLEFAAAYRLDYASALVAESVSASPPSVGGECALGTDVLEDRQEDFECLAAAVPRFASLLLAPEGDPDALDIPTPRSYVEAITASLSPSARSPSLPESSSSVSSSPCLLPASRYHGTHTMALRPSSVPLLLCLLLLSPSLPEARDPESDRTRAASPTVARLLATDITDPSFESAAASALIAELLEFAAAYRLDYASALVAESVSASPPSVGGECALGTDVLEDRPEDFECLAAAVPRFASLLLAPEGDPDALDIPTPRSYVEAITGPYSSQWQAAMDAEMASWKSTGTYVDEVLPPGVNIVDGMWIFWVVRPPGSPPAFKARYVARGFSQR
ncbi:unnamed protein product [Closterium sp. NIES-53]